MTPAILFVALEWRKYDSNICSRCMTSKFRMFNLCVLKRIQWSARAREVSWTSCSMLGGFSLAQTWYFHMLGPKWSVECSNLTAFMIRLVQSNQQIPPPPQNSKKCQGMYNVTFTFWWDRNPDPVFAKNGQHHESWWYLKMDLKLPTPFFVATTKVTWHLFAAGFPETRWVSLENTKENYNI